MWKSTGESREITQTPTNLKLKHSLKLDVHTVSHVELVVFAERVDEAQMRRRVGEPVGVLLVDPRRFRGLLALLLGRELVVEQGRALARRRGLL